MSQQETPTYYERLRARVLTILARSEIRLALLPEPMRRFFVPTIEILKDLAKLIAQIDTEIEKEASIMAQQMMSSMTIVFIDSNSSDDSSDSSSEVESLLNELDGDTDYRSELWRCCESSHPPVHPEAYDIPASPLGYLQFGNRLRESYGLHPRRPLDSPATMPDGSRWERVRI